MSIKIRTNVLMDQSSAFNNIEGRAQNIIYDIQNVNSNLDSRISSDYSVSSAFRNINVQMDNLEIRFRNLSSVLSQACSNYENCENRIYSNANSIVNGQGNEASCSGEYITSANNVEYGFWESIFKGNDLNSWINFGKYRVADILTKLNPKDYLKNGKLMFKIIKDENNFYLKLNKLTPDMLKDKDFVNAIRKEFSENIFSIEKGKQKNILDVLANEGVKIYDRNVKKFIGKDAAKFRDCKFNELNATVKNVCKGKVKFAGETFVNTFKDSFKDSFGHINPKNAIKDIKEAVSSGEEISKFAKVGKVAGVVGDVMTVGQDAYEDLIKDDSTKPFGQKLANFGVDTAVDIGTTAGSMATGAAIGSLVLPPLGTAVGAVAGVAINAAINVKFGGPPAESMVDHTKNFFKHGVSDIISGTFW